MKTMKKTIIVVFLLIMFFIIRAILIKDKVQQLESYEGMSTQLWTEPKYTEYLKDYNLTPNLPTIDFDYETIEVSENVTLLNESNSRGYQKNVIYLNKDDLMSISVLIETEGLYTFYADYMYIGEELFSPKLDVKINNEYHFYEARQMTLPVVWRPNVEQIEGTYQSIQVFQKDRYKNDVQPRSENTEIWLNDGFYDASYFNAEPLMFYLTKGMHHIQFTALSSHFLIGKIQLKNGEITPSYKTYSQSYAQLPKFEGQIKLEAEYLKEKSDPSIKLYADNQKASTPNSLKYSILNAIDAYTWDEAGRSVTWDVTVETSGLYQLSFKYIQYRLANISSFRSIKINGNVPFSEVKSYGFPYARNWKNITIGGDSPYWFYLEAGQNTITLTSTIEPYHPILETMESVMKSITELTIQIQQLTRGNADKHRDWDLTSYIPDIKERFNHWADELEKAYQHGHYINNRRESAAELLYLKYAYTQLRTLSQRPNQIPNKMHLLSEGPKSVSQYLGDLLLRLSRQPLGLEKIYLTGGSRLPKAKANVFMNSFHNIQLFFLSFGKDANIKNQGEKTIQVWVNRPRANIDLMQKMIDESYTPASGVHVNLSLMPNPTKLILSNAAGIEPDVAMGVSSETPYNFAIRNAALDLRGFPGFESVVSHFAKGSMIPYVYEDGVYGFPETQDFYITFYRTDIFSIINAEIPDTWDDVIALLPQLRRMGMNYYMPLSSSNAYKNFQVTTPFFYQNNAALYEADGINTAIGEANGIEAMKLMTELFTIHDLPIAAANFYNNFRYGVLPIGISNSSTYLQLLIAAPEIKGNWDIALFPGIDNEGVNRFASAPTSATMIFKSSTMQAEAFDFLKWWHSTETQRLFSNDIQRMFGKEYMWFSSNLEVLEQLPIDDAHKSVIIEQLSWAVSPPNMPGGYYLEREISNAWNKVVVSDQNLRSVVDEAVKNANRELLRKMSEFGYVENGKTIKTYTVPTLDNIDRWLKERDHNE